VAAGLKEAMTGTLDELAKKKRWCSRSKRWWSEDVKQLRCELGKARREFRNRSASISRFKEARHNFRRGTQRAKRECWNRFLQKAKEMMSGQRRDTRRPESTRSDRP